MGNEVRIGYTETWLLAFTAFSSMAVLPMPAQAVQVGQSGAWLLVLWIGAVGAGLSLFTGVLLERYPGRSLAQVAEQVAGPVLGSVLNLALLAWLLGELAFTLRLFTEMFITAILPNTPPSAIAIGMVLLILYAARGGLEATARTNLILAPLTALAFLATLVANGRDMRIDWLFPPLGPGPDVLGLTALQRVGFSAGIVLLAVHGHSLREPGLFRRAALLGWLAASVALSVMVAVLVAVFGTVGAAAEPFPLYSLARLVYLGRFVQRYESIFVLFWALTAMVYLTVVLHGAATTAATLLAVPYPQPLLFPLALLGFSASLLPRNFAETIAWHEAFRTASWTVAFGIPLLLLALSSIRLRQRPAPVSEGLRWEPPAGRDEEVTLR